MTRAARRWSLHFAVAWVATAVLVALCAYAVWNQRQESQRLSEITLRNSAILLAEQIHSAFDHADALLLSVGYRYAHAVRAGEPELARLTDELRHDVATNPFIKRIGIADNKGTNLLNTGFSAANAPRLQVHDRGYFRRAQAGEKALIFDGPLQPRLSPEWSLILARRIDGGDGEFLGVALATVPAAKLGEVFSKVDLGPSGVINLRTADLSQVVRVPALDGANTGVGNRNVSQTIRDLMREQPGLDQYVYRTVAPIDGIDRMYVYQKVQDFPFWLTMGRTTEDAAGAWQRTAASLALVVLPVTAFFFWVARRLDR